MNGMSIKKNCFAFLVMVFLCTQLLAACGGSMQFQDDERIYVHHLANGMETMFGVFRDHVTKFIDASDHTPYRQLVMGMCDKIDEFEEHVVMTLAKKLAEAKTKNSAVFNQCLIIVQEVLTEFMAQVDILKNILMQKEYLNANASQTMLGLKLGKELEKYFNALLNGKIVEQLEAKIDKVYALVSSAGDQDLSVRLKEIKILLNRVFKYNTQKRSGNNALAVVNGITAKIRHNK